MIIVEWLRIATVGVYVCSKVDQLNAAIAEKVCVECQKMIRHSMMKFPWLFAQDERIAALLAQVDAKGDEYVSLLAAKTVSACLVIWLSGLSIIVHKRVWFADLCPGR